MSVIYERPNFSSEYISVLQLLWVWNVLQDSNAKTQLHQQSCLPIAKALSCSDTLVTVYTCTVNERRPLMYPHWGTVYSWIIGASGIVLWEGSFLTMCPYSKNLLWSSPAIAITVGRNFKCSCLGSLPLLTFLPLTVYWFMLLHLHTVFLRQSSK